MTALPRNEPPPPGPAHLVDRRAQHRRRAWRAFRHAYPTFIRAASMILALLIAADAWLFYRRIAYDREIATLRTAMSQSERDKSDFIIKSEKDKLSMAVALARHQARWSPRLHLSIAVDSGKMYLVRDGATLRVMPVAIDPEILPAGPATDVPAAKRETRPRGERTIEKVERDSTAPAILLVGGGRIYPASDDAPASGGDVRMTAEDFKAILPNVAAGMAVYFY